MRSDGVREINSAVVNPSTCITFTNFELIAACESRGDEQVAGQEDCEGYHHPLQAHEHSRVYLKPITIPNSLQISCCLHGDY